MKLIALVELLGITQEQVSLIENSKTLEESRLESVAKALEVPVEAIKSYTDDKVMHIISNTFNESPLTVNYNPTFNPLDKLIESYDDNKKLYERLLEAEREKEKVAYLEQFVPKKHGI